MECSLGGSVLPMTWLFHRGHPCFSHFDFNISLDTIRGKSDVKRLFDPACVPIQPIRAEHHALYSRASVRKKRQRSIKAKNYGSHLTVVASEGGEESYVLQKYLIEVTCFFKLTANRVFLQFIKNQLQKVCIFAFRLSETLY